MVNPIMVIIIIDRFSVKYIARQLYILILMLLTLSVILGSAPYDNSTSTKLSSPLKTKT